MGRNVDLRQLNQLVERFFKSKGFRTSIESGENSFTIVSRATHVHDIVGAITVSILGKPNEFTLAFFSGERSEAFKKFGQLTSLLGGGTLFLRGARSQEEEEKLERFFWIYIEEKIDLLTRSSSTSQV
jgi:hypothetical protein